MIVLISDLHGVLERPEVTLKALARARRNGQRVVPIVPYGPAFAPRPVHDLAQQVAEVLSRDERDAFDAARELLLRQGIGVIEAGPTDNPALLLRKIARGRPARQVA
jgi:hypothetical protein